MMHVRLCAAHAALAIPDCPMQRSACRLQAAGSVHAGTDLHAGCASMTPLPVCAVSHACTSRIGIVQADVAITLSSSKGTCNRCPDAAQRRTAVVQPRTSSLHSSKGFCGSALRDAGAPDGCDPDTAGCCGTWTLAEQPMPPLACCDGDMCSRRMH